MDTMFSRWPLFFDRPVQRSPSWFEPRPSFYGSPSYFDPFESSFYGCPSIYRKPRQSNTSKLSRQNRGSCVDEKYNDENHEPTIVTRNNPSKADTSIESEISTSMDCDELRNEQETEEVCRSDSRTENGEEDQQISSDEQIESDDLRDEQQEEEVAGLKAEEIERRLTSIREIDGKVEALQSRVESFVGSRGSKEYLYTSETLMTYLLKLDEIQAEGIDEIRVLRKSVVVKIERYLEQLESAATESELPE